MLQDQNHWHRLVLSLCGYWPWREMITVYSLRRPLQMLQWYDSNSRICLTVAISCELPSDSIPSILLFFFFSHGSAALIACKVSILVVECRKQGREGETRGATMEKIKASFCLFVSFVGKCQQSRLTQVQIKCFFSPTRTKPQHFDCVLLYFSTRSNFTFGKSQVGWHMFWERHRRAHTHTCTDTHTSCSSSTEFLLSLLQPNDSCGTNNMTDVALKIQFYCECLFDWNFFHFLVSLVTIWSLDGNEFPSTSSNPFSAPGHSFG